MYGILSTLLTILVIVNSYTEQKQYYLTVINLWESKINRLVVLNQGFVFLLTAAKILIAIFLGKIKDRERKVN
jgi:hypothetical protein